VDRKTFCGLILNRAPEYYTVLCIFCNPVLSYNLPPKSSLEAWESAHYIGVIEKFENYWLNANFEKEILKEQ